MTGAVGLFSADQLHYMGVIREVAHGHHLLDHFPIFLISGAAVSLGLDQRVAFLAWVPVSAGALLLAWHLFVARLLPEARARAAALALALFYATPVAVLGLAHGHNLAELKLSTQFVSAAGQLWGYPQTALALAAMAVYVLALEAAVTGRPLPWRLGARHPGRWVAGAGLTASALHPWQGATLAGMTVLAAAVDRFDARWRRVLPGLAATMAPLAAYRLAAYFDPGWKRLHDAIGEQGAAPWPIVLAVLAPLVVPALAGVRRPNGALIERLLAFWILVALGAYLWFTPTWAPAALTGITLPLAILAARGVARLRRPALMAAAALALLTIPGNAALLDAVRDVQRSRFADLSRISDDQAAALAYVERSPRRGRVIAPGHFGAVVWPETGRDVWAISPLVTPSYALRVRLADDLVRGDVTSAGARAFVHHTHAAFVISRCEDPDGHLEEKLGPDLVAARHFGCVTVYELRS